MEKTDQQLIAEYLAGDKHAFDLLVTRYLKSVYSVIFHYVKDKAEAEDLTQETFIKMLRHLKKFDQEKALKPWLLSIAKHNALDWLKKKKAVLFSDLETEDGDDMLAAIPDHAPRPDELARLHETSAELDRILVQLEPAELELLFSRHSMGMTFKEIAEETHELLHTVKSRYRRLLLKLRQKLSNHSPLI